MRFLIIKSFNHHLTGWDYLSKQMEQMIRTYFTNCSIEIKCVDYISWVNSSYYFYTYKNIDLHGKYDMIFVCEGRPCKKWAKNGKIIWIPCQEFIGNESWKLICDKSQDWYEILTPSLFLKNEISKQNNTPCEHIQFWIKPEKIDINEIIEKSKNKSKLTLFVHFRNRNWGNEFWNKMFQKINLMFANIEYVLKIDNHSDVLINENIKNISRIISGTLYDKKAYHESLAMSDVYFAPRIIEGIGICSQEACNFGNIIIGPSFTTHGEYFSNNNGLILDTTIYDSSFYGKNFLGKRINIGIAEHQQPKIIDLLSELSNNKDMLIEYKKKNNDYCKEKYLQFENELKQFIEKRIQISNSKRKKICHIQFHLEGGQGLISTVIACNSQQNGNDNYFYWIESRDCDTAISSYLKRLNEHKIKHEQVNNISHIDFDSFDEIRVHWSSCANKIHNVINIYEQIKNINNNTIGMVYDSILKMPDICKKYSIPSEFNIKFCPTDNILLEPYPVEQCFFDNENSRRNKNKQKDKDYKHSPFVIGRSSRLIKRKFHPAWIYICKYLQEKYPFVSFVIMGDGEYEQELKKQMDSLKINYKIINGSYGPERVEIMKNWDLCLYMTGEHEESFGMSIAECIALKIPVICESKGALPEIISEQDFCSTEIEQIIIKCEEIIKERIRK